MNGTSARADEREDLRLLSVREVADLWSVTPQTVYSLIRKGHLRAVRLGPDKGGIRVPLVEVRRKAGLVSAEVVE